MSINDMGSHFDQAKTEAFAGTLLTALNHGAPKWKVNLKGCIRSVGDSGDTLFAGVQEGTVYALTH